MTNFEVFLASDPIVVVLGSFERVFDWRKGFLWLLVHEMSLEEVVLKVHTQYGFCVHT